MSLPTPTLSTDRLRLRPFDDGDADALFALHSNAYVLRYWDSPPWTERGRAERFIAACRQMADDGTGARPAVDRLSDGAFLGWCGLVRWNPDHRSASLGFCFADAAWGHGYATEAAGALLRWAFDTLDLNRVQAETDTRNLASARVLEKLGMRLVATERREYGLSPLFTVAIRDPAREIRHYRLTADAWKEARAAASASLANALPLENLLACADRIPRSGSAATLL